MKGIARVRPSKVSDTAEHDRAIETLTTERSSKRARMEQIYASVQARTYRVEATQIAEKLLRAMSRVEPEDIAKVIRGQ